MSVGRKEAEVEIGLYPHASRVKKKGFTLLEVLVAGFILTVVMTALFLSLSTGEFSNSVSSAKADLQAKVRLIMDWIVKDARQTYRVQINNNGPSANYIKFKTVAGIDGGGGHAYNPNYIEYSYDSVSQQLTRREINDLGSTLRSFVFNNITQSPFYTAPGVALTGSGVPGNKLIIVIAGQSLVRNSLTLNFSLTAEVKIRNE